MALRRAVDNPLRMATSDSAPGTPAARARGATKPVATGEGPADPTAVAAGGVGRQPGVDVVTGQSEGKAKRGLEREGASPLRRPQRPDRGGSLPPGQRATARFPRFGDQPLRPPPPTGPVELRVSAPGRDDLVIDEAALAAMKATEQPSDFHCVTTWSHLGITWGGVAMRAVWDELIVPWAGPHAGVGFVLAVGADGHRAVLTRDDLLAPDVLLALRLGGEPLDARHGAPLRLVSPSQYGYKSVKHLAALGLHQTQPRLGSKEHLRARVADEERHAWVNGRLLRWPYRAMIAITAFLAERSLRG